MSSSPNSLAKVASLFKQASAFDQPEIPDMPQPTHPPGPPRSKLSRIADILDDALVDLRDGYPEDAALSIESAMTELSALDA